MRSVKVMVSVVLAMACSAAWGEVKLASVFTDHMVVQRDKPLRVWGTAAAGKKVTVTVGEKSESVAADKDGKWSVKLPASKASATPVALSASEEGGNMVTINDVLVGDVWVCSGQSNMEWSLAKVGANEAVAAATDDKVRLLLVPHKVSDQPLDEQAGRWVVCSPEAAKDFSAVGYFFGKEVREREQVPIGLVGTYWGGTLAEAWTPKQHLDDERYDPIWEREREQLAAYPAERAKWEARVKEWEKKPEASRGRKPAEPRGGPGNQHRPSVLWNGMVEPLVPMSIAGVIWYQGESNAGRAEQYRSLFPDLIKAWRDEFKQGDVPFLFVQLANYGKTNGDTEAGSAWAELREAQAMALSLPKTGMAVTIDVGDPNDIHPRDKQTVGKRLSMAAAKVAYGRDVQASGPTYKSMEVNGGEVTLTFRNAKQLVVKGDKVKGFTVAGPDQRFVPAEARLDGNRVIVWSPQVGKPMAVRYAWKDDPETSLYNAAGLPMVPFRTDDWPGVTAGKR